MDGTAARLGFSLLPEPAGGSHPLDHALDLPGAHVNASGLR